MEKEFKKIIEISRKSLKSTEERIESLSEEFTEDTSALWGELKKRFSKVNETLQDAYSDIESKAELKGELGIMEARDHVEKLQEVTHEFSHKVSRRAQEELDIVALKAHLAKMESEDLWEEKQKTFTLLYEESREEMEKLAKKAGKEINEIFLKLSGVL